MIQDSPVNNNAFANNTIPGNSSAKKQWQKPELLVLTKKDIQAKHTYPQHEGSPGVGTHHGGFFATNAYLS